MALPTEYYPSYYPRVTDQWVWGAGDGPDPNGWQGQANSCVANALCSIKEIHEYKETGSVNKYSIGWIFGNRYSDSPGEEGMYIDDALDKLVSDGVPVYTELPENEYNGYGSWNYPDTYYYYNWIDGNYSIIGAKTLVNDNYLNVINKARVAKISGWDQLSLYDVDTIKQHIIDDGAVLFNVKMAQNFQNFGGSAVPSNGVVPPPDYPVGKDSGGYYHAIVAIGWKIINGKLHWLMHNNWGDWWWGDNGRCYMPYDYSYMDACFAVYDAISPDVEPPTLTITSPANGYWSNGSSITINASASDNKGVDHVNFYNSTLGTITDYTSPYSATFDISSLPDGIHTFLVRAYDVVGNYSDQKKVDIKIDRTTRPLFWEWSSQALDAFQNGGAVTNLTATEWNQFIQNIKDVVKWKTGVTPTITSAIFDGTFTAVMFNQAKNAIGGINATGITDKLGVSDVGFENADKVIGNDFIILRDKLNGINRET